MQIKAKDVFKVCRQHVGMHQTEISRLVGMNEQSVSQMINVRQTVTADNFFRILDAMGIDVFFRVRNTGEIVYDSCDKQHGISGKSDGVWYDTADSTLVSSAVDDIGITQLYVDEAGRYFIVEERKDATIEPKVKAIPALMALAFIERYGDQRIER